MGAPRTIEKPDTDEHLKDWAARIAATAPPLTDDQFLQLHALFVGGTGRRVRETGRKAA